MVNKMYLHSTMFLESNIFHNNVLYIQKAQPHHVKASTEKDWRSLYLIRYGKPMQLRLLHKLYASTHNQEYLESIYEVCLKEQSQMQS